VTTATVTATTLSLVTWFLARQPLDNLQPQAKPNVNLPSCGGLLTPLKFCSSTRSSSLTTKIKTPLICCCFILLGIVVGGEPTPSFLELYFYYSRYRGTQSADTSAAASRSSSVADEEESNNTSITKSLTSTRVWSRYYRYLAELLHSDRGLPNDTIPAATSKWLRRYRYPAEFVLSFSSIIMLMRLIGPKSLDMAYFREAHRTALQDLKASQWTFGQILAVTIWAPPLVEYIRSAIGKS